MLWFARVDVSQSRAQATLSDYVGPVEALELRRGTLETAITALVPATPREQAVARLRCLRGIDTLSAVGLAVEIGDFERFHAPAAEAVAGKTHLASVDYKRWRAT